MSVCYTFKDAQMINSRLTSTSCLLRSLIFDIGHQKVIRQINCRRDNFCPNFLRMILDFKIHVSMLRIIMFFLSTTPFCYDHLGTVNE